MVAERQRRMISAACRSLFAQYNSATRRQKRAWLGRGENLNWRHHDALALHVKRMALVHCGVVSTFQNGARFFSIREASVPFIVGVPVG